MVSMKAKYEIILRYYREGKSLRQISRELGLNRKTVTRYVEKHTKAQLQQQSDNSESSNVCLTELSQPPVYQTGKRENRQLTEVVRTRVEELLQLNRERIAHGQRKQQLKKTDIYELLKAEGVNIGYTTVCNYIRTQTQQVKEAFIRQYHTPGESCEFDWCEVKLRIDGIDRRLQLAVFTSSYSNYRFGILFSRQDTVAFRQAHVEFIKHCNGVYHQMVYDNMRVAISSFTGINEKKPTESFLSMAMFYGFSYRFCNVRKGNEKGHVERSVEYIRRKAFGHQAEFDSLSASNKHLQLACTALNERHQSGETLSIAEKFEQEKPLLYQAAYHFDYSNVRDFKVDKYSTFQLDCNRYSVPDNLVGERVTVRIYSEHLMIYHSDAFVCRHLRPQGKNHWQINLNHYLDTLLHKPGALSGSLAFQQADAGLRQLYKEHFMTHSGDFIRLLIYIRDNRLSIRHFLEAVARTVSQSPHDVTGDKIILVSQNLLQPETKPVAAGAIEVCSTEQLNQVSQLLLTKNN
jgi:transposase